MYCDFCGALADWDFRAACATGNALPGPAFEQLRARIAPALAHAKLRGDRTTAKHLYAELFARHVELCPSSYSPRIVNPDYRRRYLDYYSDSMVVRDVDPHVAQMSAILDQRIAELRQAHFAQSGGVAIGIFGLLIASQPMSTTFPDREFWWVYQAFREQYRAHVRGMHAAGVLAKYPDVVSAELLERIGVSTFVQGWLSWISPKMQAHLIADAGLRDEYVDLADPALILRRCGRCGTRVDAVTGAWLVVCLRCGEKLDVRSDEFRCPGCGGPSSLPEGATAHVCPFCGVRAEAVQRFV